MKKTYEEWLRDTQAKAAAQLDDIQTFSDPVEREAARTALAADRKHEVVRVYPAMEEHGVGFDDNDGVLYPYVF